MSEFIFSDKSIWKCIMISKHSESPGPDRVIAECYKYGCHFIIDALIDIFSQMEEEGYSPEVSRLAWIGTTWKGKKRCSLKTTARSP